MELKIKTETTHTINYGDLERYIVEKYPFLNGYEIPCGQEWGNDTQHRMSLDGKISEYDKQDWERMKNTTNEKEMYKATNYRLHLIMEMLVVDGYLEAGTYLVDVSW